MPGLLGAVWWSPAIPLAKCLFQRPDPELGVRVYPLALAARARAHKAPTSSQRYNTRALLAAVPSATTPIALMLALVSASDAGGTKACSPGATRFVYVLFHLRHFLGPSPRHLIWSREYREWFGGEGSGSGSGLQ